MENNDDFKKNNNYIVRISILDKSTGKTQSIEYPCIETSISLSKEGVLEIIEKHGYLI